MGHKRTFGHCGQQTEQHQSHLDLSRERIAEERWKEIEDTCRAMNVSGIYDK